MLKARWTALTVAVAGFLILGLALTAPVSATEIDPSPSAEPSASATETAPSPSGEPIANPSISPTQTSAECRAYLYTGTTRNLCVEFPGAQGDVNCSDVRYRVTLVDKGTDPWGLDGSGGNIGTVGVGCESNPLMSASVPTDETESSLPVTGSTPLVFVAAGAFILISGGLLFFLTRRSRVSFKS